MPQNAYCVPLKMLDFEEEKVHFARACVVMGLVAPCRC
jgi:hypothetical protein